MVKYLGFEGLSCWDVSFWCKVKRRTIRGQQINELKATDTSCQSYSTWAARPIKPTEVHSGVQLRLPSQAAPMLWEGHGEGRSKF